MPPKPNPKDKKPVLTKLEQKGRDAADKVVDTMTQE